MARQAAKVLGVQFHWTPEEKDALTEAMRRLVDTAPGEFPKITAVRMVQEQILPPHRRKSTKHYGNWSWMYQGLPAGSFKETTVGDRNALLKAAAAAPAPVAPPPPPVVEPEPEPESKARRVFWKPPELQALVREAAKLRGLIPHLSRAQAITMAQENALEPERRRPLADNGVLYLGGPQRVKLYAMLDKEEALVQRALAAQQRADQQDTNDAVRQAAAAAEQAAKAAEQLAAMEPAPEPVLPTGDLLSVLGGALRQQIVNMVAGVFRDAFAQALSGGRLDATMSAQQLIERLQLSAKDVRPTAQEPFPHNRFPPGENPANSGQVEGREGASPSLSYPSHQPFLRGASRPRKPSVCVVGLRGAQAGILEAKFGDKLDLRFHGTNDSKHQLRDRAANADHVLLFGSKIGHAQEHIVRSRRDDFKLVMGGMTQLGDALATLVPPEARVQ